MECAAHNPIDSLQSLLLRMVDLAGLDELDLGVFKEMRQLIISQSDMDSRVSMAQAIEELLATRFAVDPIEVEMWKVEQGNNWEAGTRRARWIGQTSIERWRLVRKARSDQGNRPLRSELALRVQPMDGGRGRLYQAVDSHGSVRVELTLRMAKRGSIRSYRLATGDWVERGFAVRRNQVPRRAVIMTVMEQEAKRAGWAFHHW